MINYSYLCRCKFHQYSPVHLWQCQEASHMELPQDSWIEHSGKGKCQKALLSFKMILHCSNSSWQNNQIWSRGSTDICWILVLSSVSRGHDHAQTIHQTAKHYQTKNCLHECLNSYMIDCVMEIGKFWPQRKAHPLVNFIEKINDNGCNQDWSSNETPN